MKNNFGEMMGELRAIGDMIARSDHARLDPRKPPPLRPPKQPLRYDMIMDALAKGVPFKDVAKRFGTNVKTIMVYEKVRTGVIAAEEVKERRIGTTRAETRAVAKRQLEGAEKGSEESDGLNEAQKKTVRHMYLMAFSKSDIAAAIHKKPQMVSDYIAELREKGVLNDRDARKAGVNRLEKKIEEMLAAGTMPRDVALMVGAPLKKVLAVRKRKGGG